MCDPGHYTCKASYCKGLSNYLQQVEEQQQHMISVITGAFTVICKAKKMLLSFSLDMYAAAKGEHVSFFIDLKFPFVVKSDLEGLFCSVVFLSLVNLKSVSVQF